VFSPHFFYLCPLKLQNSSTLIRNYKALRITLLLIAAITTYSAINIRWGGDLRWMRIIQGDGRGYYGNLPAIFIYDLSYTFFWEVEDKKMTIPKYYYVKNTSGHNYNKYYLGTAIMQAPFFFMGHFVSWMADKPMDGYSKLYFKFIHLGGIFYAILGLWFLSRFLSFYKLKEWQIIVVILFTYFGTNLLYYSLLENSLSHVYSFALFSAFAFYGHKFFHHFRKRYIAYLGALLGLIVVVRPLNGIIIFALPLLAGSKEMLILGIEKLRKNALAISLGTLAGLLFVFAQLLVYKVGTGSWFINSYDQETFFNLTGSNIYPFLFSYKKGMFLYTPMYLFAMLMSFYFFAHNKLRFYSLLLFLWIVIYALSSWWQWWYGGSFSARVMVEYLPFYALALGYALTKIKNKYKKVAFLTLGTLITIFCIIQTIQAHYGLIHYVDMDKEWYWRVFLKLP
jgi:hypothetical protein